MVLPILISRSLAPGSYFFCAAAGLATAAAMPTVAATVSNCREFRIFISTIDGLIRLQRFRGEGSAAMGRPTCIEAGGEAPSVGVDHGVSGHQSPYKSL